MCCSGELVSPDKRHTINVNVNLQKSIAEERHQPGDVQYTRDAVPRSYSRVSPGRTAKDCVKCLYDPKSKKVTVRAVRLGPSSSGLKRFLSKPTCPFAPLPVIPPLYARNAVFSALQAEQPSCNKNIVLGSGCDCHIALWLERVFRRPL